MSRELLRLLSGHTSKRPALNTLLFLIASAACSPGGSSPNGDFVYDALVRLEKGECVGYQCHPEKFVDVCKMARGLSDAELTTLVKRYLELDPLGLPQRLDADTQSPSQSRNLATYVLNRIVFFEPESDDWVQFRGAVGVPTNLKGPGFYWPVRYENGDPVSADYVFFFKYPPDAFAEYRWLLSHAKRIPPIGGLGPTSAPTWEPPTESPDLALWAARGRLKSFFAEPVL